MKPFWLGMMLVLLFPAASQAEKFIKSDDYKDGEEVVGKFLVDADYQLMVDDVERAGQEFDWVYIQAEGKPTKPKKLKFELQGKKIFIPEVQNHAGLVARDLVGPTHGYFGEAFVSLGAQLVTDPATADYELGLALVDTKRDSTFVVFANVQPFVEIELRLRDNASGQNVLLIRNQAHSNDVDSAVLKFADEVSKFLK